MCHVLQRSLLSNANIIKVLYFRFYLEKQLLHFKIRMKLQWLYILRKVNFSVRTSTTYALDKCNFRTWAHFVLRAEQAVLTWHYSNDTQKVRCYYTWKVRWSLPGLSLTSSIDVLLIITSVISQHVINTGLQKKHKRKMTIQCSC